MKYFPLKLILVTFKVPTVKCDMILKFPLVNIELFAILCRNLVWCDIIIRLGFSLDGAAVDLCPRDMECRTL